MKQFTLCFLRDDVQWSPDKVMQTWKHGTFLRLKPFQPQRFRSDRVSEVKVTISRDCEGIEKKSLEIWCKALLKERDYDHIATK